MVEEIIEYLIDNPSSERSWKLLLNGQNYEINIQSERRFKIAIEPSLAILLNQEVFEIKKSSLGSLIAQYPQYTLKGKITSLSDNVLSNKFTPALLRFPVSRIRGRNNQVSFRVQLKKKRIHELEDIIKYFEGLLKTLNKNPIKDLN
ncbi:MAG: hypothetical protein WBA61_08525 [Aequorivita sp.]